MTYLAAILATACFGIALRLFGVVTVAGKVVEISRSAATCIRNPGLSDIDKERMLQKASLSLFGAFASIVGRGAASFAAAVLPLLGFQALGIVRVSAVSDLLTTWQGIILTSVVMIAAYFLHTKH